MQQQLFQQPIHIRCDGISRWIEEYSIKELEYLLPDIVEDIFGISNRAGWDLLNIEYTLNPQEYDLLFKFLHPIGPIFRLCYKLLSDPYVKYKFHLSFLPVSSIVGHTCFYVSSAVEHLRVTHKFRWPTGLAMAALFTRSAAMSLSRYHQQKVRQSIADGTASSFYMEKVEVDHRSRAPLHLALNPFELYMFHFMYHVVNPCMKTTPYHESKMYSSLYLRLAEEYLSVFLPCDGSTVQPEVTHYISQSPHRSIPQKPVKTSNLFRQDVLVKMLKQSPVVNTLQTSPNVGIWRSELTVQLCIDFWLSMPNSDHQWGYLNPPLHAFGQQATHDGSFTASPQMLWSSDQLPSSEHLHAVRLLVKHLHYFANSLVEDSSAMDELKKVIIPSSQQKVYHFIRQTMQHWPLDSSFKQILEIWLSYIQPWRYLDYRTRYHRPRGESSRIDSRWLPFIAENLLVYSEIFHQLIDRFKMIDLASSRNAYMLFRLTKVLSQPGLRELICQVESSLGEMEGRGYSKWVRSHLLDLEGPAFQYKPVCVATPKIEDFIRTVKNAEVLALARLKEDIEKEEQMGFWERFFSGGGSDANTVIERRNVPVFLTSSIKNLCHLFHLSEDSITRSAVNTTPVSSRSTSINEMSPVQMRRRLNELKYEGDPDLQPIRSYENAFLVRLFYHLCSWINYNYSTQLISWYRRRDMIGGMVRQILCGPQVVYHFDKRVPGVSPRVSTSLPPRLSLRRLANYYLLIYTFILFLVINLTMGLTLSAFTVVFLFLWVVLMVVRWLLGYAPLAPHVSVHDISDLRPNLSFNG